MDSRIVDLPKFIDRRGNLSFAEGISHIPFPIKRCYWIYDVPGGEKRGGHAFKRQEEFIIALSGSFDVVLDDGNEKKVYSLNRSYYGLYVPNGIWRSMENFSTNSVALIVASTEFDENDYIRDYDEYIKSLPIEKKISDDLKYEIQSESKVSSNKINEKTVFDCSIIELDKHHREKGNITVVENDITLPFNVSRVYYLYDVPGGEERGGHGHKELSQLFVAASGSFDVVLDDGLRKRTITLNRPYRGLYVVPGIWRELVNFSSGSICLVLASHNYDERDYIRDYNDFIKYKRK